jgi:hypothetical protein
VALSIFKGQITSLQEWLFLYDKEITGEHAGKLPPDRKMSENERK